MKRLGPLLAALAIPLGLSAQADPYAVGRLDWTQVRVAIVPDTIGGVWIWFLSSRIHHFGKPFQYRERFDPKSVPSWAAQSESLLVNELPASDSLRWTAAPALTSVAGALLGWQRTYVGGKWTPRVSLILYPHPDATSHDEEPLTLDLALEDAREFLDTLIDKTRVSRYVPDSTPPLDVTHVQKKPELLSTPKLQYPEGLREDAVEGDVWLEFIVDTFGRAEPQTLKVLMADDPLFEAEAKRVILGARFKAARVDGKPVRVLVVQPVSFTLTHH